MHRSNYSVSDSGRLTLSGGFIPASIVALVVLTLGLGGNNRANAAGITINTPAGLVPGDTLRIAFVTDASTQATSTDINYYNNFVNADATAEAGGGFVAGDGGQERDRERQDPGDLPEEAADEAEPRTQGEQRQEESVEPVHALASRAASARPTVPGSPFLWNGIAIGAVTFAPLIHCRAPLPWLANISWPNHAGKSEFVRIVHVILVAQLASSVPTIPFFPFA